MKKTISLLSVAILLVSMVYLPMVLAEETIVGVVYRGWTAAECKSKFGKYDYITIQSELAALGIPPELRGEGDGKGPLSYSITGSPQVTGCYCGRMGTGDKAVNYIVSEKGDKCVTCALRTGDSNAVYVVDKGAVDDPSAVLKVKVNGKDVDTGCRCAAESSGKKFDKVVNGKCTYIDRTAQTNACKTVFKGDGVTVCSGLSTESELGITGDGTKCCCSSGYAASDDKLMCVAIKGTVTDYACSQAGKAQGYGENLITCPENVINYAQGKDSSEAAKKVWQTSYLGQPISTTEGEKYCCCSSGFIYDSTSRRCVSTSDACTAIVPGSVKTSSPTADENYIVGKESFGMLWDSKLTKQLSEKNLECACIEGNLPDGNGTLLNKCATGTVKTDVALLGLRASDFYDWMNKDVLPVVRDSPETGVSVTPVEYKIVSEGKYSGVVLLEEGKNVLEFYNEDTSRAGQAAAEAATLIASVIAGGLATKATKFFTKGNTVAMQAALKSNLKNLAGMSDEALNAMSVYGDDALKAAIASGNLDDVTSAFWRLNSQQQAQIFRSLSGASLDDVAGSAASALYGSQGVTTAVESLSDDAAQVLFGQINRQFGTSLDDVLAIGPLFDSFSLANKDLLRRAVTNHLLLDATARGSSSSAATILLSDAYKDFIAANPSIATALTTVASAATGTVAAAKWTIDAVANFLGGTPKERLISIITMGAVVTTARALNDANYEGQPASEMASFGQATISALKDTGTGMGVTLGLALVAGLIPGIGWAAAPAILASGAISSVISGLGRGLMESGVMTDATEMQLRLNDANVGADFLNIVVTNDVNACEEVKDNSGYRFITSIYDSAKGTYQGWMIDASAFAKNHCQFLGDFRLSAAGGYSKVVPFFAGEKISCTGCSTVSTIGSCGSNDLASDFTNKIAAKFSSESALCCEVCTFVSADRNILVPFGFPSTNNKGPTSSQPAVM